MDNDEYLKKPYFCLPGTVAEPSIALSCLSCFDYTNALADVVVGYMAAPLDGSGRMDQARQTLTVRNGRGGALVDAAIDARRLEIFDEATGAGAHERIASATVAADSAVLSMTGGEIKDKGMPRLLGEVMATVMRAVGPKGVAFARYSIDYHILRNYLHVLDVWGEERAEVALPSHARDIVQNYLETDEAFAALRDKVVARKRLEVLKR